jgi:superfamily II DNA or RNA helicase
MQRGMNIPQADRVLFLTRSWTAKTEQQAEGRVLRPQQTRPVTTEFLELKGSIDSYQRQMVAHKADAICAGLDWGAPTLEEVPFMHLDSILHRFVDDLATSLGCRSHEVRGRLIA